MKGESSFFLAVPVLITVLLLALAATYFFASSPTESRTENPQIVSGASLRFSLQGVRDNVLLVRNDGTQPIPPNILKVYVNEKEISYEQSTSIESYRVGEFVLPMVPGNCTAEIEVSGAFQLLTTDANLCVYAEEFEDPLWNVTDARLSVQEGVAHVAAPRGLGIAYDPREFNRSVWVLEMRIKGDSPEVMFLRTKESSYVFGISSRGSSTTEASFWVGDSKKDSHSYPWAWNQTDWYRFKISSEGNGIYFGKVWKDDAPEPAEWSVFLTDSVLLRGHVAVLVDAAGEEAAVDYIRVYVPD